jgi:hypothetical protein
MNTGELSSEVPLSGNAATYVDKEFDCTVSFKLLPCVALSWGAQEAQVWEATDFIY